jgi:hypothetical protein
MLRTSMIALAAATVIGGFALGSSAASAAPIVDVRVYESGPVQPIQPVWYRYYPHRYWYHHHRRWWW